MKGIMGAKKKPFTQLSLADLGINASEVGEAGARERVMAIGKVEARAAGQVIKDDGSADRKSTRLNSSHANISYAVFCLKKKKSIYNITSASDTHVLRATEH